MACPNRSAVCRSIRPGGESASGKPALSSGLMSQRSKAAVTWRVSMRSGEISAAVIPSWAAIRRRNAMASASARGDAASIKVMFCVAAFRSPKSKPSRNHWSVTGAGRNDSDTNLLRCGCGAAASGQGGTSFGETFVAAKKRWNRYCGWSSDTRGISSYLECAPPSQLRPVRLEA